MESYYAKYFCTLQIKTSSESKYYITFLQVSDAKHPSNQTNALPAYKYLTLLSNDVPSLPLTEHISDEEYDEEVLGK